MSTGLLKATSMPKSSTRKTYCCQRHHFQLCTTIVVCVWNCDEPCQEEKNIYLSPFQVGIQWGAKQLRSNLERVTQTPGPMTLAAVTRSINFKDGWMDGWMSIYLEHSEEEENHINNKNKQIRSQAAKKDQDLNSRVEFLFSSCSFLEEQKLSPDLSAVLMQRQCLVLALNQGKNPDK